MKAMRLGLLAAFCSTLPCIPAAAQLPQEPVPLFTPWSEQVAGLDLGSVSLGSPASPLWASGKRCVAAGAVGWALGRALECPSPLARRASSPAVPPRATGPVR